MFEGGDKKYEKKEMVWKWNPKELYQGRAPNFIEIKGKKKKYNIFRME
ncbi:MAG: hypothetical protein V1910_02410 [bacterium]